MSTACVIETYNGASRNYRTILDDIMETRVDRIPKQTWIHAVKQQATVVNLTKEMALIELNREKGLMWPTPTKLLLT